MDQTSGNRGCTCGQAQDAEAGFTFTAPGNCAAADCPFNHIPPKIWEALLPRPFRKRHPILFWGGLLLAAALAAAGILAGGTDTGLLPSSGLAVVRVEGPIMEQKGLLKWIRQIERDENVRGVLLRVDSPGGGVGASQEIYGALKRLNEKKPVVASLGSTAASGGLMVSLAARWIVANPSTVTGSIGVRMDRPQYYKLLDKLGLWQETLTTAPYKDAGSPLRPLNDGDRKYFTGILQDMHQQFVDIVAEGRGMDGKRAAALADGKIFTGREALTLGLVDQLGGQEEALARLRELTGLPEDTEPVERPESGKFWKEMAEGLLGIRLNGGAPSPAFLYQF